MKIMSPFYTRSMSLITTLFALALPSCSKGSAQLLEAETASLTADHVYGLYTTQARSAALDGVLTRISRMNPASFFTGTAADVEISLDDLHFRWLKSDAAAISKGLEPVRAKYPTMAKLWSEVGFDPQERVSKNQLISGTKAVVRAQKARAAGTLDFHLSQAERLDALRAALVYMAQGLPVPAAAGQLALSTNSPIGQCFEQIENKTCREQRQDRAKRAAAAAAATAAALAQNAKLGQANYAKCIAEGEYNATKVLSDQMVGPSDESCNQETYHQQYPQVLTEMWRGPVYSCAQDPATKVYSWVSIQGPKGDIAADATPPDVLDQCGKDFPLGKPKKADGK